MIHLDNSKTNLDVPKISLMIAELREMQENYPHGSAQWIWINEAIKNLDGASITISWNLKVKKV